MLYFYCFIFYSDISSTVIGKFNFYYFSNCNVGKMIIWQPLSNSHIFTQVLLWKLVIFVPLLFHLKKDRLNTYVLTNIITFVKYLKSFEVQQIKHKVSDCTLDDAIILSLFLFHFVYFNVFSSFRDTLSQLIKSRN